MGGTPPVGCTRGPSRAVFPVLTALLCGCSSEPTVCAGNAEPCGSNGGGEACAFQAGCSAGPFCEGTAARCASRATESACLGHPGCTWEAAYCHGEAQTCESFDRRYGADCEEQAGCTWDTATRVCSGVAAACGTLAQPRCSVQNGCTWSSTCGGRPTACSAWAAPVDCGAHDGCRWNAERCTGEPTPCADLPVDLCAWQEGCHAE